MSQNKETLYEGSEDLFTTQDLLPESQISSQLNDQLIIEEELEPIQDTEMSEDILEEDELIAESEDLEAIAEDIELSEDNLEAMQEDSEQTTETITLEGSKSKPKYSTQSRISELPLSKVKHIIKLDPDVKLVNSEAVFLITKAAEAFIKTLAKESFNHAAQQKKKTITKSHVDQALSMLPVEM